MLRKDTIAKPEVRWAYVMGMMAQLHAFRNLA